MLTSLLTLASAIAFVFIGNLIAKYIPPLDRFALPGAVVGGVLALVVSPQLIYHGFWPLSEARVQFLYKSMGDFPGLFINVVFACLMLGRKMDPISVIWNQAKPQIVMGHVFAWGQYVVGLALAMLFLKPFFDLDVLTGPLIAIGFQGGHGTAAGLGPKFEELGFAAGRDFALTLATFGVLIGVVLGPILTNILSREGGLPEKTGSEETNCSSKTSNTAELPHKLQPNPLTGSLTIHLALICGAIGIGWSILEGFQLLEQLLRPKAKNYLSEFLPLFSVVLISGMLLQVILQKTGLSVLFSRELFDKISSFALDMVIVTALATLSLELIGEYWGAILLLCGAGLGWNLAVLMLLGPRVYPKPWYAYGVGDFGGGTATTASGIMLIRVVDPHGRSKALEAYTNKQPFYEPIMGGGLVTAMALPTVAFLGALPALGVTSVILTGWLVFAWRLSLKWDN